MSKMASKESSADGAQEVVSALDEDLSSVLHKSEQLLERLSTQKAGSILEEYAGVNNILAGFEKEFESMLSSAEQNFEKIIERSKTLVDDAERELKVAEERARRVEEEAVEATRQVQETGQEVGRLVAGVDEKTEQIREIGNQARAVRETLQQAMATHLGDTNEDTL